MKKSSASQAAALPFVPAHPPASVLLDGFGRLMLFLVDEEADFLCGAPCHVRSPDRVNYRRGRQRVSLITALGPVPLSVPWLARFHLRPSLTKRAKRLNREVFQLLAHVHDSGPAPGDVAALIKMLWTVELSDALLASLVSRLIPVLRKWRASAVAHNAASPRKNQPAFSFSVY